MVLELKVSHEDTSAALAPLWPVLLGPVLSFSSTLALSGTTATCWRAARHVPGGVLRAHLNLPCWLSLFPFATAWMGESHFARGARGSLRSGAADGGDRLLVAAVEANRAGWAGVGARAWLRRRLAARTVAVGLHRRYCCELLKSVDPRGTIRGRRVHMAGAGTVHRRHAAPCCLTAGAVLLRRRCLPYCS